MSSDKKSAGFEATLEKLQAVVKKMEGGELSLDESLAQFEEGVKLTRECQSQLTAAEQKIEQLITVTPDGKAETQAFNPSQRG